MVRHHRRAEKHTWPASDPASQKGGAQERSYMGRKVMLVNMEVHQRKKRVVRCHRRAGRQTWPAFRESGLAFQEGRAQKRSQVRRKASWLV